MTSVQQNKKNLASKELIENQCCFGQQIRIQSVLKLTYGKAEFQKVFRGRTPRLKGGKRGRGGKRGGGKGRELKWTPPDCVNPATGLLPATNFVTAHQGKFGRRKTAVSRSSDC